MLFTRNKLERKQAVHHTCNLVAGVHNDDTHAQSTPVVRQAHQARHIP